MAVFGILKEALEPRPSNEARVAAQFAGGRSVWHEPWDKLLARVNGFGQDISVSTADTYLRLLRRTKKFAVAYFTAKRMMSASSSRATPQSLSLSKGVSPLQAPGTAWSPTECELRMPQSWTQNSSPGCARPTIAPREPPRRLRRRDPLRVVASGSRHPSQSPSDPVNKYWSI
jgi:hypothetical protein